MSVPTYTAGLLWLLRGSSVEAPAGRKAKRWLSERFNQTFMKMRLFKNTHLNKYPTGQSAIQESLSFPSVLATTLTGCWPHTTTWAHWDMSPQTVEAQTMQTSSKANSHSYTICAGLYTSAHSASQTRPDKKEKWFEITMDVMSICPLAFCAHVEPGTHSQHMLDNANRRFSFAYSLL